MRKLLLALLAIVLLLAIAGVVVASELRRRVHEPLKGYIEAEQFIEIPQGAGSADIRRRLSQRGALVSTPGSDGGVAPGSPLDDDGGAPRSPLDDGGALGSSLEGGVGVCPPP